MINQTVWAICISAFMFIISVKRAGICVRKGTVISLTVIGFSLWSNNLCDFVKGDCLDGLVDLRRWSEYGI